MERGEGVRGRGLLGDSAPLGIVGLGGSEVDARRSFLAFALALNGGRTRGAALRAADLAQLLGVSEATVRADWQRLDVREASSRAAVAGLLPSLAACYRSGLVLAARRAAGGDLAALGFVGSVLERAGREPLAPGELSVDEPSLEELGVDGLDVFASAEAARVALELLENVGRGTPCGGAGGGATE